MIMQPPMLIIDGSVSVVQKTVCLLMHASPSVIQGDHPIYHQKGNNWKGDRSMTDLSSLIRMAAAWNWSTKASSWTNPQKSSKRKQIIPSHVDTKSLHWKLELWKVCCLLKLVNIFVPYGDAEFASVARALAYVRSVVPSMSTYLGFVMVDSSIYQSYGQREKYVYSLVLCSCITYCPNMGTWTHY